MQTYGSSSTTRATSVRIFEARLLDGTKCFIKEYLPVGLLYGKREFSVTRKLSTKWRALHNESLYEDNYKYPPFPILLGYLKTDDRILDIKFRSGWIKRFPRTKPPEAGNMWLVFRWDEFTFRSLKLYPNLPQVVEGLDYFQKNKRIEKRWRFIRKLMKKVLETVDFLHKNGYCHNAIRYNNVK